MTNLVKLREAQGLRQEDVAKILGVSRQAYCTYENDKRQAGFEPSKKTFNPLYIKAFMACSPIVRQNILLPRHLF